MWDQVIAEIGAHLPPFNDFLLRDYREREIKKCADFMQVVFQEATRLLNDHLIKNDPTGKTVQYLGYHILSPDERVAELMATGKTVTVDILPTELMLAEYRFQYGKDVYPTRIYLPYLTPGNKAIVIAGTKYYLQLPLTDKTFYQSKDAMGIKVMRSPLHFWRQEKVVMTTVRGARYLDDVITTRIHHGPKNYKPAKDDLRTPLLLYLIIQRGFYGTLDTFGIPREHIQLVETVGHEPDFEYIKIRGDTRTDSLTPNQVMDNRGADTGPGLYMKVHSSLLNIPLNESKTKSRVVSSIYYTLQYFARTNIDIYRNTAELIGWLLTGDTVWTTILGKTIYGLKYEKELQANGHALAHLASLQSYLDPVTQTKLRIIGVECQDIYDLFVYVFGNIDRHIVNRSPNNLYDKRINILDLLLGRLVHNVFTRVYAFTKRSKPKPPTPKDIESLLRMGSREIHKIYDSDAVKASPAVYNDNYLIAVGSKKVRANNSGAPSSKRNAKPQRQRLLTAEDQQFHASYIAVESITNIPSSSPGIAGTINLFLEIDDDGNVLEPWWSPEINILARYLS